MFFKRTNEMAGNIHWMQVTTSLIIISFFIGCVELQESQIESQRPTIPKDIPAKKITSKYPKYHKDGRIEVGENIFFYTSFGTSGKNFAQFNNPQDITMDKDGYLYIADTDNHRIQKFTPKGDFVAIVGTNTQFIHPSSLAVDNEGKIYCLDSDNLIKLNPQGNILKTIRINNPKGVAVEGNNLYVTSEDKILCFDTALLNLKWTLSSNEDWNPFGIAVKQSYIYVTDIKNNCVGRILRQENSTNWICSVRGVLNKPLGIAVNNNHVYVTDTNNHRIWLFEKELHRISKFGREGNDLGEFNNPSKIAVKENKIYVVDTGNSRIQIFEFE